MTERPILFNAPMVHLSLTKSPLSKNKPVREVQVVTVPVLPQLLVSLALLAILARVFWGAFGDFVREALK